ncbi:amino acid adenylation domain-containing protein [Streptomyces lincolnensis]|uniref:amino acid adenylation domain-containing protein n=1 Tax=Streptomyces lincolnensis TaxID=1915 RepID=UPI001E41BFDF|nr:amino acid adenylation domain-containing protein [Streptomyces lincolnensis]MCD7443439.1 amino acid adenylation domain-containing protein [Streptomyces lincolnensis]
MNANEKLPKRPSGVCLPDLLLEQRRRTPDRVAVVHGEHRLSYSELADSARDVGAFLVDAGVTRDSRVGVLMEPSIDLMVGIWGTLFSGGAYLPLSPEYPEERLAYMMRDADVTVVLTQEHLRCDLRDVADPGVRVFTMGETRKATAHTGRRLSPPRPDDLAYVIHTSGSTGKPKGVMIEHRALVNQLEWLRDACAVNDDKRILQKTPISFDAAQWEILAPACGAAVVMGEPGMYRDPEALIDTIVRYDVTTLQCVPTLLQALIDTEELSSCRSLRQVFSGGEALSRRLARQCLDALPDCRFVNLYGPTECTINASAYVVDRTAVEDGPPTLPIGTPVHGTTFHVLDARGRPAPAGEVGELHIGGVQVARGYLNRPDLTAERFMEDPFAAEPGARLYRTGDLAHRNPDGTVQFVGRADNQVKLRGYRVELDEISRTVESHDWVRNSAVLLRDDSATGFQNLVAFVELNPREAALMDQGNHSAHHRSKGSRLQVRAQLSNNGCRDEADLAGRPVIELPGAKATPRQRALAFARKTYRFYEGGEVRRDDLLRLLSRTRPTVRDDVPPRTPDSLDLDELGSVLRNFGQYLSDERLLPKFAYASPGSLYATQLYLELTGLAGVFPGLYYYHPVRHHLVRIGTAAPRPGPPRPGPTVRVHFLGKHRAIEPVYRDNIREVLEIEAGHMVGLFEEVLPEHGLDITATAFRPAVQEHLDCAPEDHFLGSFDWVPYGTAAPADPLDVYVQSHPGKIADLAAGLYRYADGRLERVGDSLVRKKHVVAINQRVYERAAFGIAVVSRGDAGRHVGLGRALQRLQTNDLGIGLMASGYSSRSGNDLPAARRLEQLLVSCGLPTGPSYFFVGGRVSDEQVRSEGMKEDTVHMQGPAELIKEDLAGLLPHYMVPHRVVVLDRLPLTANGKIDTKALESSQEAELSLSRRVFVAPRSRTERRVRDVWRTVLKRDQVSVRDDFFGSGGNSLLAVALIHRLNRTFGSALPFQTLFEAPTVEKLARRLDAESPAPVSRLVPLQPEGTGTPLHCWPGLGGYPMNLRPLAAALGTDRPVYGVQAHGINQGEIPYGTVREMASADIEAIREVQPSGPYLLCGYSFGARVAFEAAYRLEQAGERVEQLFLVAPGQPRLRPEDAAAAAAGGTADFADRAFLALLFSVFAGTLNGPVLDECLRTVDDEDGFTAFVTARFPRLDEKLVRAVTAIVKRTYSLTYEFHELTGRRLNAPVTLLKAADDDYSFVESRGGYSAGPPAVHRLGAGHYAVLREPHVAEPAALIRDRLAAPSRTTGSAAPVPRVPFQEVTVPHVNIKHFPAPLTQDQESELIAAVTTAVRNAFGCAEDVVSIALEPVERKAWNERVYVPEIVERKDLLRKAPTY